MKYELAQDNFLRYNAHGGAIIRQSDLSAWSRCQLQKYYYDRAANDPNAPQPRSLSATVYGTVVHYSLMLLERLHHEGNPDALAVAQATFEQYWHPDNLTNLTGETIDEWLPRQTYGGLRERGRVAIRDYYRLMVKDDGKLLALEYQFAVPIEVDGRLHTLTGTIDRLSVKKHYGKPYLAIEDFKTGKQPTYLRYNMQGNAYAYATMQREFWRGWKRSGMGDLATFEQDDVDRLERMFSSWDYRLFADSDGDKTAARRFRWVNIQEIKFADAGWRNEHDYARLHLAIDGYVRACEAGVYGVNTTGEVCKHCPFRQVCGGIGLPMEKAGAP